jgi:uncharacterized protein YfaP (DUF2135 family)
MKQSPIDRSLRLVLAAAVLLAPACGSDGPTTPPATVPPAPTTTVVAQGSGAVPFAELRSVQFTTAASGRLEVVVDWTFASNDVDMVLVKGTCTDAEIFDGRCDAKALATAESATAKPERLSAAGTTAGTYTLYVANFGPGDESISYQVLLAAGAASASARVESARSVARTKPPVRRVSRLQ